MFPVPGRFPQGRDHRLRRDGFEVPFAATFNNLIAKQTVANSTRHTNGKEPPVIDVDVVSADTPPLLLTPEELVDLRRAKALLQTPGVAVRFANLVGAPLERGLKLLPAQAGNIIQRATRLALERALHIAVLSLEGDED